MRKRLWCGLSPPAARPRSRLGEEGFLFLRPREHFLAREDLQAGTGRGARALEPRGWAAKFSLSVDLVGGAWVLQHDGVTSSAAHCHLPQGAGSLYGNFIRRAGFIPVIGWYDSLTPS